MKIFKSNTKDDILQEIKNSLSPIIEKIDEALSLKKLQKILDIEKHKLGPLLAEFYQAESSKDMLVLACIFDVLADIRLALGKSTNNLKFCNDAAIRLQYARKIIKSKNLDKNDGSNSQDIAVHARDLLKSGNQKFKNIHAIIRSGDVNKNAESNAEDKVKLEPSSVQSSNEELQNIPDKIVKSKSDISKSDQGNIKEIDDFVSDSFSYRGLFKQLRNEMHVVASQPLPLIDARRYCGEIKEQLKGYLALLFRDAERAIGPCPGDYEYVVIGLGSMALEQTTPYSDLEFAILYGKKSEVKNTADDKKSDNIDATKSSDSKNLDAKQENHTDDKESDAKESDVSYLRTEHKDAQGINSDVKDCPDEKHNDLDKLGLSHQNHNSDNKNNDDTIVKEYFKRLSHYIHFKVIMFGETSIPISDYGLHLDHLIKPGVQFDLGGKTPLGRPDKNYALINTVEGLLKYVKNEGEASKDKFLHSILQASCYVCGKQSLVFSYQQKVNELLQTNSLGIERAVERLSTGASEFLMKGHLEALAFHPWEDSGKIFDVKNEIYRLADRFIYNLGLICQVPTGESGSWEMIDNLHSQNKLSRHAAENLKKALSFATILRIKIYDFYGSQAERMDTREVVNNDPDSPVFHITIELSEKLFEYYYIIFPLMNSLSKFTEDYNRKLDNPNQIFLNNSTITSEVFFQNDAQTEGRIFLRLLKYYKALECFKEDLDLVDIIEGNQENKQDTDVTQPLSMAFLYDDVGSTCYALGKFQSAKECFVLSKEIKSKNKPVVAEMAKSLNQLGLAHVGLKEYKDALTNFYEAYKQYGNVKALRNIGMLYHLQAQKSSPNITRIDYLQKSTWCFKVALITNDKQSPLDEAEYLIGMGMVLFLEVKPHAESRFETFMNMLTCSSKLLDTSQINDAIQNHQNALEILYDTYSCHPILADTLNQMSKMYYSLRDYDQSLNHRKESLTILKTIYERDNHKVKKAKENIDKIKSKIPKNPKPKIFNCWKKRVENLKVVNDDSEKEKTLTDLVNEICENIKTADHFKTLSQNIRTAFNKIKSKAKNHSNVDSISIDNLNECVTLFEISAKIIDEVAHFLKEPQKNDHLCSNVMNEFSGLLEELHKLASSLEDVIKNSNQAQFDLMMTIIAKNLLIITNSDIAKNANVDTLIRNAKSCYSAILERCSIHTHPPDNNEDIPNKKIEKSVTIHNIDDANIEAIDGKDIEITMIQSKASNNGIYQPISTEIDDADFNEDNKNSDSKTIVSATNDEKILLKPLDNNQVVNLILQGAVLEMIEKDKDVDDIKIHNKTKAPAKAIHNIKKDLQKILDEPNSFKTCFGLFKNQQVGYASNMNYDNEILNYPELLMFAKKVGGPHCVNQLIELGKDKELAESLIDGLIEYGATRVINVLFQNKNISVDHNLESTQPYESELLALDILQGTVY